MANPQPTDAHLRVAHCINEAIMTRDFTKRQRKILDLILRLSWGCGSKDSYIPHQKDFSVVGVHEVDIKNELEWLQASKVIGREGPFYWFNKNFDDWQVSRVKPYQPEKLSKLLRLNLNGNRPKLSKTLSENLVKHEDVTKQNTKFPTPNLASPKERLNKIKEIDNNNGLTDIFNFITENLPKPVTSHIRSKITKFNNIYPGGWVLKALQKAVELGKPTIGYTEAILKDWKVRGVDAPPPERKYKGNREPARKTGEARARELAEAWGGIEPEPEPTALATQPKPESEEPILISGQSIENAIAIVNGEVEGVPERRREYFKRELERLGVELPSTKTN